MRVIDKISGRLIRSGEWTWDVQICAKTFTTDRGSPTCRYPIFAHSMEVQTFTTDRGPPTLAMSRLRVRHFGRPSYTGWWFGPFFVLPYTGNNHPDWLSYFSEGWNHQPVYIYIIYIYTVDIYIYISIWRTLGSSSGHPFLIYPPFGLQDQVHWWSDRCPSRESGAPCPVEGNWQMGRSQLWDKPSILRVKVDPRCRSTMFDPCLEQYFEYMGSIVSSLLYCSFSLSLYIYIYTYIHIYSRRKFRSQTSDNMDRWKAEQGRGREKRKIRRKKSRRERLRRKKVQMREKVGKSRFTVFFQWFGAPEGRKVGSLKRRVRSQLAKWEMKKCTPLWREAHFEVKSVKNWRSQTTFGSWDVEKVHAVVARSTFPSQNVQNTSASDHFWKLRCRKSARRCGAKHISKSKCTKH